MPGFLDKLWGPLNIAVPIIETVIKAKAAQKAAQTVQAGQNEAIKTITSGAQPILDLQRDVFGYQQQLFKPYYEYGTGAMTLLGDLMGVKPSTMPTFSPTGTTGAGAGTGAPLPT